jgi:DNA-binding LytR/AlgR family response regulator
MKSSPVIYKDLWFKIIGCLFASYIVDALNREETLFQRLSSKYFYVDIAGGFVISLAIWEMVRFATRYLDKRISWVVYPLKRILLQFVSGVFLPALFCFVFTMLWMKIAYNQDIFKTSWLFNEFYAAILIILLINLIYFTWWLFLAWREQQDRQISKSILNSTNADHKPIEVSKAGKTILLPQINIAYSYLSDGYCYIKTVEADIFVTTYSLDELTKMLNADQHFRVNRQMLISKKACKAYKSIEFGKIEVDVSPAFKDPVIVSQKRAKEFRKWISIEVYN